MEALREIIWSEWFWFPPNSGWGWKHLENKEGSDNYYPEVSDLHWSIVLGVVLIGVRYLLETVFVVPLALSLGVKEKKKPIVKENAVLETAYKKQKNPDHTTVEALGKQTDLTDRQVQLWFRHRRIRDAPSNIQKFRECSWHFIFYLTVFVYGLFVLWQKPWFWSTKYCWIGWPNLHVDNDVYWYYMIELGFYWSLIFTLFTDHKRKDFTEMVVHHFVTVALMYFSWILNFVRVGSLVLIAHDASDFWMAAAKMCRYSKMKKATDVFFGVFLIVWIVSRLGYLPMVVLYTTTVDPYWYVMEHSFGAHIFFNALLYTLQVLHIIWSYMIGRIVYRRMIVGQVDDVRSDSSDSESEDEKEEIGSNGVTNHVNLSTMKTPTNQKSG